MVSSTVSDRGGAVMGLAHWAWRKALARWRGYLAHDPDEALSAAYLAAVQSAQRNADLFGFQARMDAYSYLLTELRRCDILPWPQTVSDTFINARAESSFATSDGRSLMATLPAVGPEPDGVEVAWDGLSVLSRRDANIVWDRWVTGWTLAELADWYSMSVPGVAYVLERSRAKLERRMRRDL